MEDLSSNKISTLNAEMFLHLISLAKLSLDVWIGFNDVASPSPLPQGEEGFDVQSCQNWLPGEPHPSNADHCVRMSPAGQCNTDLCTAKHSYVCEHKPQGEILLNADRFQLGSLAFDTYVATRSLTEKEETFAPSGPVETLVFPSLAFQQEGFLVALELVTQKLQQPAHIRFQVHRPAHPKGCNEVTNVTDLFLVSQENENWTPMDCPVGFQWCHSANSCQPLGSCCHQEPCANSTTQAAAGVPPPCQNKSWSLELKTSHFMLPLGPSMRYLLLFRSKDTLVKPNDTVIVQHDAGPGALLLCHHPSQKPLTQMGYFTLSSLGWDPGWPAHPTPQTWRNNSRCPLRVLAAAEETVPLLPKNHSSVHRPGLYAVQATVSNGIFRRNFSCSFWALSAISSLRVIYPPEKGGKVYVESNSTWLVVKILSGMNATSGRLGGNQSFPFGRSCPPAVTPWVAECARESNDTWFSVVLLDGIGHNLSTVVLWAKNAVSSQNITVRVKAEDAIRGLRVTPDPETRVLQNKRVVSHQLPVWDFGDGDQAILEFHPPYNESFLKPDPKIHQVQIGHNLSHIYQDPGEYSLTVVVSNEFENLTYSTPVHIYAHLTEVAMRGASDVLVVGHPVTFEAQVMPSGFGVSYTWNFGDGSEAFVESQAAVVHTYSSRGTYKVWVQANNTISTVETCQHYRVFEEISGLWVSLNETIELLTPIEISASVETGDNITWIFDMGDGTIVETPVASVKHTYLKDMNYTVNVTAVNPVNSLSRAVPIQIFVLMVLKIEPSSCIREDPEVQLTAHVSGNPQNYFFDWTFGDGSSNITVYGDPTVIHNFTFSGIFRLSLVLSSKVNKAQYYTEICVEPEITNVTLSVRPELVWLGNETKFQVTALPPFRYHYLWDFGTNNSTRSGGTEVSYTYRNPGDYMVMVTVCNNVSFNNVSASVEVQEPVGVAKIESNGSKVLELNQVYLFWANVTGTKVSYLWYFGDGTSQLGKFITHSYNKSGTHTISLTCWNDVSFHEAKMNVTVKRRLQGLSINASRTVVPLNGSVSFVASLLAGTAIRYSWILCDRCTPIPGLSTISYTFRSVGTFNVIVTAENEIGGLQSNIFIYVLEQIEGLQITGGDFLDNLYFPTNKTLQLQAAVKAGTNISYNWTVLKESHPVQTFTGKVFSLVILEAGPFDVHLKATNMLGSSAVNKTVEFIEEVGALKPTATPNPAAVNASVNISAGAAAGSGLLYTWHFEGGLSLCTASSTIAHSFLSPGAQIVAVAAGNKFGSANASLVVCVQEPIMGPEIRIVRPNSSSVESGTVVNFAGELERGSDVLWTWKMQDKTISGQRVALNFPVAGIFPVCLNASNNVSWDVACLNLTVQDAIQGLKLSVSEDVLQPGQLVSFEVEISSGSSVSYWVTIGSNHSEILSASNFTYKFSQVGEYLVRVTAENQVSVAYAEHLIVVLEAVRGLQIADCCERGMPAVVEKQFTARIEKGSQVSYVWHFTLVNEQQRSQVRLEGQSVSYTPEAAGQLDIHLCAFNSLSSLNVTVVIQVQDFILQLSIQPVDSFVNRTTWFKASVLPSAREVLFWWHFGDGSPAVQTSVPSVSHVYLRPGDYVVEVNATNLISFSIAHRTVTVRILECEEPEAELALPAQVYMKRSQKNYLEAQIDLRGCTRYQTAYLWEIYKTPSCLHLEAFAKVLLVSVDVNRPQLVIPKLTLDLGNYCFKFLVSFGDTPLSKSIFANVTVLPNKLVPIIDGGSYRVWSSTRDLILDGEKSYDPNWEDWEQTPLHYHWTCVSSSKNSPGAHGLNFSATGGLVTIPRAMLEADVEYTFDLTISKPGMDSEATNQTVCMNKALFPYRYVSREKEPFLAVCLFHSPERNCTASKEISLEDMKEGPQGDPRRYTIFVPPGIADTVRDHHLNITNHFVWSPVEVTLGLYSSLCQYFNTEEARWKTEGMAPLEGATPEKALCLTQHLTAFGASLFVPPHSVQFIKPPPGPGLNYIVLLTCVVCLVTYSMAAVIVHKLDLIDISRVGSIPFCGKNGLYRYEILVKTGWGKGSGTTAHVGITLYGMDSKSGHRHLDDENAFRRNSLDIFQMATERNLGSVWKIRIWHDNKGLSPAWFLQHVIVRDLQTYKSYHFLVNDWLSVDSLENDGLVEKEVFAASEADLRSCFRIFVGELQRGFFERHVWLSLWDRPPRSRFTRVQRASCCCLLIFLFLCANAVWYGVVADANFSPVPISTLIPINGETVLVGLVSSLVVYPLYLVLLFLFRMARSKVNISQSLAHSDQQSLEIDNYLDSSLLESSFITFPGLRTEAFSEETKTDLILDDSKSLIRWQSNEALLNWPDLLSDPSIMGNTIQKLKRGRTSRHLGLEAPLAPEGDALTPAIPQAQARYFSASDEDLIRQILADGAGGIPHLQEVGNCPKVETDLLSGLSNVPGDKMEAIVLQRLNEKGQSVAVPGRELNHSAKSTRTVVDHHLQKRLLPSWCSSLAHAISLLLLLLCFGVSVWIGVGFSSSVALMWLISGIFSFLSSFLLWEPLKILLEAVYFSLVAKRLHPEEDDTLVEHPIVEHISEKIGKVRPPQGFALFQAKEEARKVKLLHSLLKNCFVYMFFLLVILLTNYSGPSHNSQAFLLQKSIKQQLGTTQFLDIKRVDDFWLWATQGLLPFLYRNRSAQGSSGITLGVPRLRQIRLREECLNSLEEALRGTKGRCAFRSNSFDSSGYTAGWKSPSDDLGPLWTYSPPDLAGAWYWGYLSIYDSGGYIQELGTTLQESNAFLQGLQQNNWISNRSQAVFVEMTQYHPVLDLHAAVTLRLEFPVAKHAVPAVTVTPFPLHPLGRRVTPQLLMMVFLMILVVYFVVSESLAIKKEGKAYFALLSSYGQWLLILASTCTVVVHLSQATLAERQWAKYLKNKRAFTSFYPVASLHVAFSCLAASLLFLLTVKASQQLRFIRQWSTFGKALQKSSRELLGTGLAFAILALAYTQLGYLLFSSTSGGFSGFGRGIQLSLTGLHSGRSLPGPAGLPHLIWASYVVLQLWCLARLFPAVLIRCYHETRLEMYRPAFESQDYEMVELFLRRLKMWMGFSKAKEGQTARDHRAAQPY
ncbi:polycystin-1 [Notechis scutatus]|uniref:Polycystin-1 n=1 Tax=Notechis scutatus TaxID=8663 RepID=A0A6J1VJK4_9SAUR|nr:polycystin-1 [Notechis scutatus]